MGLFRRKEERAEQRVSESDTDTIGADLLRALLDDTVISRSDALQIPAVNACISRIARIVSSLPIKLYKQNEDGVEEIKKDERLKLLNSDTQDTLTATQFWRAIVEDYYLGKGAYVYINKEFTHFKSIHYIENEHIGYLMNVDPIFKDYDITVDGQPYSKYKFIKFLRNTKNGYKSIPIHEENYNQFAIAYATMLYERVLLQKGGNKKGFLESDHTLTEDAIQKLKDAFRKLYNNNSENVVVLNKGIKFQESSNTSVEMQINENKETNFEEICAIFGMNANVLKGKGTKQDITDTITNCIIPLLNDFEASLDRDFLTEEEKETGYFWAFDAKELKRGDLKERYEAYEIAYKNNWIQVDEIRQSEDMKPLGFNFIRLGLDSVLYNPNTGEVYTPNTGEKTNIQKQEGVKEKDESGNQS